MTLRNRSLGLLAAAALILAAASASAQMFTGFVSGDHVVRAGPGTFHGAAPGVRHGVIHDGGRTSFLNVHGPDAGFAGWVRSQ